MIKDTLGQSRKPLESPTIKCSVCHKDLGLEGEYWLKFVKNHPNLHHKDCK